MPNAIVQIGKFMWAIQLPMSSLNIMSYIIRTRRFTLRDVRLHSLHSLAIGGGGAAGEAYPRCEEQMTSV
jgi:hypothetical protein